MEKIAILYGPEGGSTEKVATMVANALGNDQVDLIKVKEATEDQVMQYNRIIFGGPTVGTHTWADNHVKDDWDLFLTRLYKMNLQGKTCAIFGLGDQVGYSFHFVDDIGIIAERLITGGAKLVGKVTDEGYDFDESKAFDDGYFLGLPLDEDNEPEKTADRIESWVEILRREL